MSPQTNETQPEAPQPPERVEVNDLTQFVTILVAWHQQKVAELTHLLSIPDEGHVGVLMLDDDGKEAEHVMQGDKLEGFKAGVKVALVALGTLPFGVTYHDPVAAPDEPVPVSAG